LISRKIWRAFPELDQYDDEVCKQYVNHARRASNIWKGAVYTLLALFIGFAFWVGVFYFFDTTLDSLDSSLRSRLLISFLITGFIWFPLLCAFVVRDAWLRRSIKSHISSIRCDGCGYQLVGLTIEEDDHTKFVLCPECGYRTELNRGHITEADINPELV